MKYVRRAFTLTEMVIVIVIIGILSGLLVPALSRAKRAGKVEVSKTYLREMYVCVAIYAQEQNDQLPDFASLTSATRNAPKQSPLDIWRKPIDERHAPLIGSYAYGPAIADEMEFCKFSTVEVTPLLADVFCANYRLGEFDGPYPDRDVCVMAGTCEIPELIWFAYSDGSLRAQKNRTPPGPTGPFPSQDRQLFGWPGVFDHEYLRTRQGG